MPASANRPRFSTKDAPIPRIHIMHQPHFEIEGHLARIGYLL